MSQLPNTIWEGNEGAVVSVIRKSSVLAVLFLFVCTLGAAETFTIDQDEYRLDRNPDVAFDSKGRTVIAWASHVPHGAQQLNGIRIRRIGKQGQAVGSEIRIDRLPGFLARFPAVDISRDGGTFVVVWEGGAEGDRSRRRIWAQIMRWNGQPVGPEIRVDQQPLTAEHYGLPTDYYGGPKVSMAPSGEFVVVWRSEGQESCDRFNISARRFSARGNSLGDEFLVNQNLRWSQVNPDVGHDGEGRFVVVWQSGRWLGTAEEQSVVHGRIFDREGVASEPELILGGGQGGAAAFPALTVATDGTFACVWKSRVVSETLFRLSARAFGSDGRPAGKGAEIEPSSIGIDHPQIVSSDDDHILVAWSDQDFDREEGVSFKAQSISTAGQIVGDPVNLDPRTCFDSSHPAVAVSPSGEAIAVWQSSRAEGIEGRRFPIGMPLRSLPAPGFEPTTSDLVRGWRDQLLDHRSDIQSRREAAINLGCMMGEAREAVGALSGCLESDQSSEVRAACVSNLAAVCDDPREAVQFLVGSLVDDGDAGVRQAAASALGELGGDAILAAPALIKALSDSSSVVRSAAALALGRIGAVSAIDELLDQSMSGDPSPFHSGYLQGLGELADNEEAFRGIQTFGNRCIEGVVERKKGRNDRYSVKQFFGEVFYHRQVNESAEKIARVIETAERRLANGRIGIFGEREEAYREYFEWLDGMLLQYQEIKKRRTAGRDCGCLIAAASGLARINPLTPEAASSFRVLLDFGVGAVCGPGLLEEVQRMGSGAESLSGTVARVVREDRFNRLEAVRALAAIDHGSENAIVALGGVLADGNPAVREAAVKALVSMGSKAIRIEKDALIARLDDDHEEIRELADGALDLIEVDASSCDQGSRMAGPTETVREKTETSQTGSRGAVQGRGGGRSSTGR